MYVRIYTVIRTYSIVHETEEELTQKKISVVDVH